MMIGSGEGQHTKHFSAYSFKDTMKYAWNLAQEPEIRGGSYSLCDQMLLPR